MGNKLNCRRALKDFILPLIIFISSSSILVLAQTRWENKYPYLFDIAQGNGVSFIAGDYSRFSVNFTDWSSLDQSQSNAWVGVTFGHNVFVAADKSGKLFRSMDAIHWSLSTNTSPIGTTQSENIVRVEFLENRFFVVGRAIYSSEDGLAWKVEVPSSGSDYYTDILFDGTGFLAVGSRGTIAKYSGNEWVLSQPFGSKPFLSCEFFKSNYFLVSTELFISDNGNDWDTRSLPFRDFWYLFSSEDSIFGIGGGGLISISADGGFWSQHPLPTQQPLRTMRKQGDTYTICGGGNTLLISPDGTNWTSVFPQSPSSERLFAAAGDGINRVVLGNRGTILHSTTGGEWEKVLTPDPYWLYSVVHFNDQFVASGSWGNIHTSPDGRAWTRQTAPTNEGNFKMSVANDRVFAGGWVGTLSHSTNGINWTQIVLHTNLLVRPVLFGHGRYVVAGSRVSTGEPDGSGGLGGGMALGGLSLEDRVPSILVSTDLQEWTPVLGNDGSFYAGAFGNGIFLLAGSRVAISEDGFQWRNVDPGTDISFDDAIFANGKFYLVGYPGSLLTSSDGIHWSAIACSTPYRLYGIGASGNSLIVVGEVGTIVEAPFDVYFGPSRRSSGEITHRVYGAAGPLTIESSADLSSWSSFLEVPSPSNPFEFTSPSAGTKFFRVANPSAQ